MTTNELARRLAAHLTGANNNCVFEVDFPDRLPATAPDKAAPTVLCGATAASYEAPMAAEKLARLGYTDVQILQGGLAAAQQSDLPSPPARHSPLHPNHPTAPSPSTSPNPASNGSAATSSTSTTARSPSPTPP